MNAFRDPHPEDLPEALTELYHAVPPPPHGLQPGRQRFLAKAAHLRAQAAQPATLAPHSRQRWLQPAFRFATLALVALFALTALTGGLVHLAEASLPGDLLYPLKIAYEDLRLSLTSDPAAGAERNLNYATQRVNEMQGLAEQGDAIPDQLVDRLVRQMDRAMEQAASAPAADAPLLMEQFRLSMSLQQQVLIRIQKAGPDGDQPSVRTALQATERAYELVDAAQGDPKRFQLEWLHQQQPEEPPMEGELQYRHEHQFRQPESAGPPPDDQIGPPPAPPADAQPGSQNQSGPSRTSTPPLTPSPGKNGR
jgi:hypothetical protein